MNGKVLKRWLYHFLDVPEGGNADYLTEMKAYDCLDMAADMFIRDARILHNEIPISTVSGQSSYLLPADFLALYIRTRSGRYCIRYEAGTAKAAPVLCSYDEIFLLDEEDARDVPSNFAITEIGPADIPPPLTGTVTATAAASGGRSVLTDADADFVWDGIAPRDVVVNATSGATGLVLDVVDATHLGVAIFDSAGAPAGWTDDDAYSIQSATRQKIVLPAPSATAGHIMTVPYLCKPLPVYSDFGVWPLPDRTCKALAAGAAAIFKLPKTEYVESKALGGLFNEELRRYQIERGARNLQSNTGRHRERIL